MDSLTDAEKIRVLREALDKAVQLASVASDWNLYEVEIDGEMVSIYDLKDEFDRALSTTEPAPREPYDPAQNTGDDLLRRSDVCRLLHDRAQDHANMTLEGAPENARAREAMEAAFKGAAYAVAFMPATAPRDSSASGEVGR